VIATKRRRSFASSGLSYEKIARDLGLRLCPLSPEADCREVNETYDQYVRRHIRGEATISPWDQRKIHWSPERMTHRGLRRFLLVATYLLYPLDEPQQWARVYRQNLLANELAARFGVRFPRAYSARDRARVRLSLSQWRPTESDTAFPEQRNFIRRAKAWSRL